ncbi:MAG: hypothetical protein JO033_06285 [Acidobacteriaceae bacterium]|nr:hypothetical protein [Acidobacteriaceae bacterium]MBV9502999.1 hypothetical protein [Acidobacteriaceae bacterium]
MSLTDAPNPAPEPKRRSVLEKLLPFTTVAVIIAALYVAWTFYSRYEYNKRTTERIAAERAAKEKQVMKEVYGSGEIRFTTFSIDTQVLKRGQTAQLCYGVVNAKTVTLDPPVEPIKPMYFHCLEIAPKKTTTYTITAENGAGQKESKSLTLQVK